MKHTIGHNVGANPQGAVYQLACGRKAVVPVHDLKFGQVVDLGADTGTVCADCRRLTARPQGNVGGFDPRAAGLGTLDDEVLGTDTGRDEDGTVLSTEVDDGG